MPSSSSATAANKLFQKSNSTHQLPLCVEDSGPINHVVRCHKHVHIFRLKLVGPKSFLQRKNLAKHEWKPVYTSVDYFYKLFVTYIK